MNLRIAILGTRGIPNNYGGFESLAEHLAPALADAGHEVFVYNSHNHPYQGKDWKGAHIIHCYDPEFRIGSAGQFVYDFNCILDARKRNFDVILQLGYTSSSIWGRLFPKKSMVIYNMDGLEWKRTKYSKWVRKFLLYAEKLAVRFSDFYISDSLAIQSYLRNKYSIHSEFITYGAELFPTINRATLKEYKVSDSGYYMLIARMEPENNIEMILEGFTWSRTDKEFLVVGDTNNSYGQHLLHKFGPDRRIRFVGSIYDAQKVHDLRACSYLYFHGHSVGGTNPSLLEAMASGVLIAANENIFNKEVLGKDAYYFSCSGDIAAIVETTCHREKEAYMIAGNQEKIRTNFNWPNTVNRYERFILRSLAVHRKDKNLPVIEAEEKFTDERNILYRRCAD